LKMPAFEWVHVQLHQQKGMISLSPPTICNSALFYAYDRPRRRSSVANVRYLTINLFKYPDKNIQSGSNE
ncbi:hypothetical protein, partial [Enterobacter roggenkampii]|uniref:hypothetical protein n=1 Tax=Enterobacter roggenkampii TaxID=1812935 RepID=UPI001A99C0E4